MEASQAMRYIERVIRSTSMAGWKSCGHLPRLGHSGVTGEWVFGQRTNCGIMAAPYGRGFPAMDEDCSWVPTFDHSILDTEVRW
jgi:hypothetical protein